MFCDGGSSLAAIHGVFVPFVNRDGDALGSWNEGFIYENLCVVGIGWIWIWKEINSNIHKNIRVEFDPLLSFELRSRALAGSRMLFWLVSTVSTVSRVHSAAVSSPDDEYILTGDTGPVSPVSPVSPEDAVTMSRDMVTWWQLFQRMINISQWHDHSQLFYKFSFWLQGRKMNKCGWIESDFLCINLCTLHCLISYCIIVIITALNFVVRDT